MEEFAEQLTLPQLGDRDMAWLDPGVIALSFDCSLGEVSSEELLEAVRGAQDYAAASRMRTA